MTLTLISTHLCFGGEQRRYQHTATSLSCDMVFSVFVPQQAMDRPAPVLYWLSGLTCTDENFVTKAGAQRYAAEHGIVLVAPDTSPRGDGVPDDPDASYDFGLGAGFYVDATEPPWRDHYRMHSYVVDELPDLVAAHLPVDPDRQSVFGHSMGGHGALTLALRYPERYRSVSAFAPIVSPMSCPWGEKALGGYLGADRSAWAVYDAVALLEQADASIPMRIDQGGADDFLETQLKPDLLTSAAERLGYAVEYHLRPGYDHSYFFIASFIDEHIEFHARHLVD